MKVTLLYSAIVCLLLAFPARVNAQINSDGRPHSNTTPEAGTDIIESHLKGYYSQVFSINPLIISDISLYGFMEPWLGTPYRYGGKSKSGIDCSGFVNTIYKEALCTNMTGGSAELYKQVEHISKDELREGDLVFFRIRRNISHVGIYLGDGKFIHASRSSGVIVSNLDAPYYKRYFAKGGRIFPQPNGSF
jgi:lipoprotein Spr